MPNHDAFCFDGVAFGVEFLDVKIIFDLVVHA